MGAIAKLLSYPNKILSNFINEVLPKLIHLSVLALCLFFKHYQIFKRRRSYAAAVKSSRKKLPDSAECSVCLLNFAEGGKCCELAECGHSFHRRCVERWLKLYTPTCPLCRTAVCPEAAAAAVEENWVEEALALALLNAMDVGNGRCNVNGYF